MAAVSEPAIIARSPSEVTFPRVGLTDSKPSSSIFETNDVYRSVQSLGMYRTREIPYEEVEEISSG